MSKEQTTIRLDIWGGDNSMDHVARSHHAIDDPSWLIRQGDELRAGFLVNVRALAAGEGWGLCEDFDERKRLVMGRA